jgi:hypothetical protein
MKVIKAGDLRFCVKNLIIMKTWLARLDFIRSDHPSLIVPHVSFPI